MMAFEITPYVGVGSISLGMTREQVRAAMGAEVKEFRKMPSDEFTGDAFDSLGIHVAYRHPGVCSFVEFSGSVSPTFQGEAFLGRSYREVQQCFETIDPSIDLDGSGLTSLQFGIAIYAQAAVKEPDEPVEAVSIFERGYYDEWLKIRNDPLKYYVVPHYFAGPIKFGMAVEEVRRVLGVGVQEYDKPGRAWFSDAFESLGIHVDYRTPGVCAAVEFTGPGYPILGARRLLGKPYSEIRRWFAAIDPALELSDAGFTSPKFGIAAHASIINEGPHASVEAVIIFEKDSHQR